MLPRLVSFSALTFDLDGTLVDSLPDLHRAANLMLSDMQQAPLSLADVGRYIGGGAEQLVRRVLGAGAEQKNGLSPALGDEQVADALALFRRHYRQVNGAQSRLFPGVIEALAHWQAIAMPLALVTNKPEEFTLPLLQKLAIARFFPVIVCGDTLAQKKPHPAPILAACQQLGIPVANNCHIGDSLIDYQAARAADSAMVLVNYGYNAGRPLPDDVPVVGDLRHLIVGSR